MKTVRFFSVNAHQAYFSNIFWAFMLFGCFVFQFSAMAQGRGSKPAPTPPANRLSDSLVVAWHLAQLSADSSRLNFSALSAQLLTDTVSHYKYYEIGRASCRERV